MRKVADQCLDLVMDTDEEWAVRIRTLKFQAYNQQWLQVGGERGRRGRRPECGTHSTCIRQHRHNALRSGFHFVVYFFKCLLERMNVTATHKLL